jgi:hypothetical protein
MVRIREGARRAAGVLAAAALVSGCDVVFGIEEGRLDPGALNIVPVAGNIQGEVTWTRDTYPSLERVILVESGATLTIEPGTTVFGQEGSALVVLRGGRIIACGTADAPIVFTSPKHPRAPGDWGGLMLLGNAKVNTAGGQGAIDELSPMDTNDVVLTYGGNEDEDDSGKLCYVRVEFGGQSIHTGDEFSGLALYGIGKGTEVHHVEAHESADNSVTIEGGTVDLKYVLATAGGDGIKWSSGWRGNAQFIAVVMGANGEYGNGVKGESNEQTPLATPVSEPTLYNVTIVAKDRAGNTGRGLVLTQGTKGYLSNVLVNDYSAMSFDLELPETIANAEDGSLDVKYSMFASVNNFDSDKNEFDEEAWAEDNRMNILPGTTDVGLRSAELETLDLSVESGSQALTSGDTPPSGFFDPSAEFIGACGEGCPEFEGWTAFPRE